MSQIGIYFGMNPLDSPLLQKAKELVPELDRVDLPIVFEAIESRRIALREHVSKLLEASPNSGPDYVQKALLSVVDGSYDFEDAPEEVKSNIAQVSFIAPYSIELTWNSALGFYATKANPALIERMPLLAAMDPSLNSESSLGLLFPVPISPKREIEKLTLNCKELDQGEIDLLHKAFLTSAGPWWFCGSDLKVVKDESERIIVSRPPLEQKFLFYKPQTRADFLEEHREELLKLSPVQRDCVIISLASPGAWAYKGRVVGISVDPVDLRVDFSLYGGGVERVFNSQTADEFIERIDASKLRIRKQDVSWFIDFISENEGPWNKRSFVERVEDHPSGAIVVHCMDDVSAFIFPPAAPDQFLESLKDEISKLDLDTQNFIRYAVERDQQPWCLRGYIQKIEGSISAGLFFYKTDGNRLAIFKDQSVEDFLEKQVKDNPLISVKAKAAIEREVIAKADGPWTCMGYVIDFEERAGELVLKLSDGEDYRIKI